MGWAVGMSGRRWIGYGVPATCDYVGCTRKIDRGLGYKCEKYWEEVEYPEEVWVEEEFEGCGLFFCGLHEGHGEGHGDKDTHESPDVPEWVVHMLTDSTWEGWRDENPEEVSRLKVEYAEDLKLAEGRDADDFDWIEWKRSS